MSSEIPSKNSHGHGNRTDKLRVFTDGDVMARTKNRQEEKSLKTRLGLLDCQQHRAEEVLAKERKFLMEGRRKTLRTSGRSPVVEHVGADKPSDSRALLKHLRKPWAFSFTETSYNAVYNDDFDPYMCRPGSRRTMVERSRRTCMSAPPGRGLDEVDRGRTRHRPLTAVGCLPRQRTGVTAQEVKSLESRKDRTEDDQVTEMCIRNVNTSVPTGQRSGKGFTKDKLIRNITSTVAIRQGRGTKVDAQLEKTTPAIEVSTNMETVFVAETFLWKNSTICCDSGVIVRDPILKINDNNNNNNNNFKVNKKVNATTTCSDLSECDDEPRRFHNGKSVHDSKPLKSDGSMEGGVGHNATAEEFGDTSQHTDEGKYVVFKGRKIYNYVRPQDRYKRDPFKETRQEKLLHRLAIEHPWYLTGNRPMSADVRPQFSKRSRDWALKKMILDNMTLIADTRKPVVRNAELDRRVKEFCYPLL